MLKLQFIYGIHFFLIVPKDLEYSLFLFLQMSLLLRYYLLKIVFFLLYDLKMYI